MGCSSGCQDEAVACPDYGEVTTVELHVSPSSEIYEFPAVAVAVAEVINAIQQQKRKDISRKGKAFDDFYPICIASDFQATSSSNAVGSLVLKQSPKNERMRNGTQSSTITQICMHDLTLTRLIWNYFAHIFAPNGESAVNRAEVDTWLELAFSLLPCSSKSHATSKTEVMKALSILNKRLNLRTFLVDHSMTIADIAVYVRLRDCLQKHFSCHSPSSSPSSSFCFPETLWTSFPCVGRHFTYFKNRDTIEGVWKRVALLRGESAVSPCSVGGGAKGGHGRPDDQRSSRKSGVEGKSGADGPSYEGKLPNAKLGEVVTRFPPEPSGYLHIGHAKAALLNHYFARMYQGKMILRFDDTNPAKEKMEFEDSIKQDLRLLEVMPDRTSHTSDYFAQLQDIMTKLINEGKAYVDDTPTEQMREERGEGIESKRRNQPLEENLRMWREMVNGSAQGTTCCVRAKIDMQNKNKCLRDPVMYRCVVDIPHHLTGTTWKAYPTYDFACPVVDALEGVTHAMRTNEYSDRIPQYEWVLKACGFPGVTIYEFSRLSFVRTLLSKRKLQRFVDKGVVTGWDDPRFPTVRGITRRGLTVKALLEFLLEQGPSKAGNLMEWDKLWAKNKQVIDPIVPRYMAVAENCVELALSDGPKNVEECFRPLHPKNPDIGECKMFKTSSILLEHDDAIMCEDGEEITLMRWGNCIIDKIVYDETEGRKKVRRIEGHLNLDGDFKKTKKKLHWLPCLPQNLCRCIIREYDHLITVDKLDKDDDAAPWEQFINPITQFDTLALADPELSILSIGSTIQLERRGYFRLDTFLPAEQAMKEIMGQQKEGLSDFSNKEAVNAYASVNSKVAVLFKVPDGKSKSVSTVSTKVDSAKLAGTKQTEKKRKEKSPGES